MADGEHRRQARRAFLGAATAALLLAGCQVVPSGRPRPPVDRPPTGQPTPTPTPGVLPSDADRHRVAVLVPLSGENGGVGRSLSNAANLAILDAGGDRIRITTYDTARAGGAAAAANEALADGNRLFLGPLLAEDVTAVAPLAQRADVPVIAFSNDIGVAGNGVYVMGFTPGQSIGRVVAHARAQNMTRFAALTPDGVYGRRAGQAMIETVQAAGGRMVGLETFNRAPGSLQAAITRLGRQSPADAVLIADNGRIAMAAAPLLRKSPAASARILGTELWKTENDLGSAPALRGAWFAAASDTLFNQLRTRYRARYGVAPYRIGSLGYDAVLLTIRIARDWRVGRAFPENALRSGEGFTGVDGAFRFGPDGVAQRSLEVLQVGASGNTTVSPAPRGF